MRSASAFATLRAARAWGGGGRGLVPPSLPRWTAAHKDSDDTPPRSDRISRRNTPSDISFSSHGARCWFAVGRDQTAFSWNCGGDHDQAVHTVDLTAVAVRKPDGASFPFDSNREIPRCRGRNGLAVEQQERKKYHAILRAASTRRLSLRSLRPSSHRENRSRIGMFVLRAIRTGNGRKLRGKPQRQPRALFHS